MPGRALDPDRRADLGRQLVIENKGGGNGNIYTIGGSYNLSKRTLIDIQIASARNSSTANFGLNANAAGDTVSTDNPLPGHSQTGVYAGIQHSF